MRWDHKQSVKEVLRHVITSVGADSLLIWNKKRKGLVTGHLDGRDAAQRFGDVYRLKTWVHAEGQASASGLGSEAAATATVSGELPALLRRLGCRRLLDVGCGDWNWMRGIDLPCGYIGVDIVPEVIEANGRHLRPGVEFAVADAIAGPLPEADVALCRDVLFHLSLRDGRAALANIRRSARWMVATTNPAIWFNSDIRTGDFREINLQRAPYRLGRPVEVIADSAVHPQRVLGVWATEDLPAA